MDVALAPDVLSSKDLQGILNVGAARLSQLRKLPGFPEPLPGSTPRKPRWARGSVVRYLVDQGSLEATALDGLDGTLDGVACGQRWRFSGQTPKLVDLPTDMPEALGPTSERYCALKYDHINDGGRSMVVLTPAGSASVFADRTLRAETVASLLCDLSDWAWGERICIAVASTEPEFPGLLWADVRQQNTEPVAQMHWEYDGELVSDLLGHRPPRWIRETLTAETLVRWQPTATSCGYPTPVTMAEAGPLETPGKLLAGVKAVFSTESGALPAEVADGLAFIGSAGWDSVIRDLEETAAAVDQASGWVNAQIVPPRASEMNPPPFPAPPAGVDWLPAMGWLARQPRYRRLAELATGYFGFIESVGISHIDSAVAGADLWAAIGRGLRSAAPADQSDWIHESVRAQAGPIDDVYTQWVRWANDHDANHPALLVGRDDEVQHLYFHVPRTLDEPLTDLEASKVAVIASDDAAALIAVSALDEAIPLPSPVSAATWDARDALTYALAGLALGLCRPVLFGGGTRIRRRTPQLRAIIDAAYDTGEPRTLAWATLQDSLAQAPISTPPEVTDREESDRIKADDYNEATRSR